MLRHCIAVKCGAYGTVLQNNGFAPSVLPDKHLQMLIDQACVEQIISYLGCYLGVRRDPEEMGTVYRVGVTVDEKVQYIQIETV
jgi:hypothetical protein